MTDWPNFESATVTKDDSGLWHALWAEAPAKFWPGSGPTPESAVACVLIRYARALERRGGMAYDS